MKWLEARAVYDADPATDQHRWAADVLSDAFFDLGLKGVILEDPEFESTGVWDDTVWTDESTTMPAQTAVIGYFAQDSQAGDRCRRLAARLAQLAKNAGIVTRLAFRTIEDQDWMESWKAYFQPQRITQKIIVTPTWHAYEPQAGEHVIAIDPGMAFGTGTHPTSQLCIQMMETYLCPHCAFLDIGTGSGILLIAAAMLGAEQGMGIDIDADAIGIARKNLAVNHIDETAFRLRVGSFRDAVNGRYGFIAANLLPKLLLPLFSEAARLLLPGGILVCSGIPEASKPTMIENMTRHGFGIVDIRERETWVAIAGKLKREANDRIMSVRRPTR